MNHTNVNFSCFSVYRLLIFSTFHGTYRIYFTSYTIISALAAISSHVSFVGCSLRLCCGYMFWYAALNRFMPLTATLCCFVAFFASLGHFTLLWSMLPCATLCCLVICQFIPLLVTSYCFVKGLFCFEPIYAALCSFMPPLVTLCCLVPALFRFDRFIQPMSLYTPIIYVMLCCVRFIPL